MMKAPTLVHVQFVKQSEKIAMGQQNPYILATPVSLAAAITAFATSVATC
jgi:hypothetical protein